MAVSVETVSAKDFIQIKDWFDQNRDQLPKPIDQILNNLIKSYSQLVENKRDQKEILFHLRQAMGLIPKTEKGSLEKK